MKKSPDYKNRAKNLKALGLINFDLRKTLTPAQKGVITKKVNALKDNYKTIADNPSQFFTIKAPSARIAQNMDDAGYIRTGKLVYIRKKKGLSNYKFDGDELTYRENTHDKKAYYEIRNFFPGTQEFFEFSKKLRDDKIKLKRGETFTLKIGGNSHFKRSYFTSLSDFTPYLQLMMQGTNLKDSSFSEILPHIQFVKLVKRK